MSIFSEIVQGGGLISVALQIDDDSSFAVVAAWIAGRWPGLTAQEVQNVYDLGLRAQQAGQHLSGQQGGEIVDIDQVPYIVGSMAGQPSGTHLVTDLEIEVTDPVTGSTRLILIQVAGTGLETIDELAQEAFQMALGIIAQYPADFGGLDPNSTQLLNFRIMAAIQG